KIAMRFDEDATDRLIGVSLLTEEDDVLLATRHGKAIRFAATDVREFQSRDSTGVRGARVIGDDEIISMSVLRGFAATPQEREDYLRAAPWKDRREGQPEPEQRLSDARMTEFAEAEEFILTVCANGYGKRSSAYEYRRTNRGGQGITNIDNLERNGPVVASFPAHRGEQLMLVTDQAKLIRMAVGDTRVIGRNSAGVRLFNVADDEHVVSAAKIDEDEEPENEAEEMIAGELGEAPPAAASDQVTLDDGTGPETLPDSQEEDGDEG
ncbi:MAG: DNA gyrase C-terminal beta-propeller domain-containing protein, partial [Allosphingosinicella sp.]